MMRLFAFSALGLLALACRFTQGPIARAATPTTEPMPAATPAPPAVVTVAMTPSAVARTPAAAAPCEVRAGSPVEPDLASVRAIAPMILDFLNQGGSPQRLNALLQEAGRLAHAEMGAATADFTGNGSEDLALSILDLEEGYAAQPGILLFFVCSGGQFQLAYSSSSSSEISAPLIHASGDLNGDGIADLLTGRMRCGAHTCFEQIEALVWNGTTLENRLQGVSDDLPWPQIEIRSSPAGSADIAVTATGIGSIGAGPFRLLTRVWTWSDPDSAFLPTQETLHPSSFRIHVLHDADDAALAGNFDRALALYQSVISDQSLDDWLVGAEGHANLAAYARFRRVVTILQIGDQAWAKEELDRLLAAFPTETQGSAYASMAQAFWQELQRAQQQGGDDPQAAACAAAQAYAVTHSESILEPLYYGYANRSYGPADICPVVPSN